MPPYHGKGGVVYASTSAAGVAATVVQLTEWTLNMATDKVDVTSFGDLNKTYVQGFRDITGTLSGWWDSATDTLFDGSESADGINMYLYPSQLAPTIYFYGPAWLDASITVPVSGAVGMTGNFVARGSWARKP
jgi:hypothetical protein